MIDAVAEIGDQLHVFAGLGNDVRIDMVGDRRHEHVGLAHRLGDFRFGHGLIIEIELRVEQFAHPGLDGFG